MRAAGRPTPQTRNDPKPFAPGSVAGLVTPAAVAAPIGTWLVGWRNSEQARVLFGVVVALAPSGAVLVARTNELGVQLKVAQKWCVILRIEQDNSAGAGGVRAIWGNAAGEVEWRIRKSD